MNSEKDIFKTNLKARKAKVNVIKYAYFGEVCESDFPEVTFDRLK